MTTMTADMIRRARGPFCVSIDAHSTHPYHRYMTSGLRLAILFLLYFCSSCCHAFTPIGSRHIPPTSTLRTRRAPSSSITMSAER